VKISTLKKRRGATRRSPRAERRRAITLAYTQERKEIDQEKVS